jgi:hypothetical protein
MTEARELHPPNFVGEARIKVHPGPELSLALERFMNPEYVRSLGGRAIELVSERRLSIYDKPFEADHVSSPPPGISKGELAMLTMRLKQRQSSLKPTVSPLVSTGAYVPPKERTHEGAGIDMRFKIVIDELTQRLLANTILLNPDDNGLYAHLIISRPHMQLGMRLPEARDNLLDVLRRKPQQVESMYVDSDVLKP